MNATESQMTTNPQPTSDEGQTETPYAFSWIRWNRRVREQALLSGYRRRRPLNTTPPRAA